MPIVNVGGTIQPCFVTGNIATLSGGAIPQGIIIFQLYNIGPGTIPQVLGVAEFPNLQFPVMTDQNGAIQTQLWGNDVINPANTQYLVTFRDFNGREVGPVLYSIVGPSFNLNTATPQTTTVPPVYSNTGYASGAAVSSANFAINGWGTGATITNVTGVQERCSITVTAGATPSVAPTVVFTYPGAYPTQAWNLAQMTSGSNGAVIADILSSTTTTAATFTYSGLPATAGVYVLVFDTKGN